MKGERRKERERDGGEMDEGRERRTERDRGKER